MTDETGPKKGGFRPWMLIPAMGAFAVMSVFALGLNKHPDDRQALPSMLIDKPAPQFDLEPLFEGKPRVSTADLKAPGVKLLNFYASWCGPCRVEHPWLMGLAKEGVTIIGIDYKDKRADGQRFLTQLGDPYTLVGFDASGRTGIEFGITGVPETFVIDGNGDIVYRHVGPIQANDIATRIRPAIEEALKR